MALELVSVVAGGGIGLAGGLAGVLLGHILTSKRDAVSRSIAGLQSVVAELNRLRRLALYFDQQINLGLPGTEPFLFARDAFNLPGWKEATHELQEGNWRFPCMAYLSEAKKDFVELNRLMGFIMDPYAEKPEEDGMMSRSQAIAEFQAVLERVQSKVEDRLKRLI